MTYGQVTLPLQKHKFAKQELNITCLQQRRKIIYVINKK